VFCGATGVAVAWIIRWMWAHLPREAVLGAAFCLGILLFGLCVIAVHADDAARRALRSWRRNAPRVLGEDVRVPRQRHDVW
jgi:hypothetical protein